MLCAVITSVLLLFKITNAVTITTTAQDRTECGNLTCFHGAKCRNDSHGQQSCLCEPGYRGTTCNDDADECGIGHGPCMHRGYCHNNVGSYRCECLEGWSGDVHCDIKVNSTTEHLCIPGWSGDWCQDQCLNDSMCRPTEVCKNLTRGHYCLCAPGWHGKNCTIDRDECATAPCPKTATCMNTPGSYECPCLSGWKGDKCDEDIDECLINPCQHSSTCTNEQGYYNCTCALGWKGANCIEDINECTSNPCANGKNRICVNSIGSFECTCTPGWKGVNCTDDVNECQMTGNASGNPCKHSGLCVNTLGSYTCNCTSGWQGENCDDDIDECNENPCNGTFTCENSPGSFSCSGKQMSSKGKSGAKRTYIIVGAVLGSLLMVFSIVACLAIVKHKWNAKRVDKEQFQEQH